MKKIVRLLCLFLLFQQSLTLVAQQTYHYVLKDVTLFDGSGGVPIVCDVAISQDTIAFVGKLKAGNFKVETIIDGKGLCLSPGFIDPHTHYLSQLESKNTKNRMLPRALMQGVTTVFVGNDGSGPLPIGEKIKNLEKEGVGVNVALLVGHNSVRKEVLGTIDVQPNLSQLNKMKSLVEQAMFDGAFGISTGLFYNPGNFAKTEEVIELSKVAAKYGGIYDTHQRDEGSQNIGIVNSVKEVLNIGYKTGIPVHFSHIKLAGPEAWKKRDTVVGLIEKAQREGVKVTANQYPYTASQTGLSSALMPAWVRDGGIPAMRKRFLQPELHDSIIKGINGSIAARTGDASKLFISSKSNVDIHNKSIQEIANKWKLSPAEAVIKMCTEGSPSIISFMMQEEDVVYFMNKPWVMTGSDGGDGHPRAYGTFAKVIGEYAMKKKIVPLSTAIYKSSYQTAQTFNIEKRGLIKPGYFADLFLFNPKEYKASSSFDQPARLASGVKYLWVNGKLSIENGNLLTDLSGKILRHKNN